MITSYRADPHSVRHCDGCGKQQWLIGRSSVECAHCGDSIPLAHIAAQPNEPIFFTSFSKTAEQGAVRH